MNPAQLNQLKQQASKALELGDLAGASVLLTPAHKKFPNDPEVNWLVADLFIAQGHAAQGALLLKKAAERKSNVVVKEPLLEKAAEVCGREHLDALGLECASAWLKHNSTSDKARFFMGLFLYRNKRYSECITHLKKVVKQGTDNAWVYKTLGEALGCIGEHKTSFQNYKKGIALAPEAAGFQANFLLACNAMPFLSDSDVSDEHISYGKSIESRISPIAHESPKKRPKKLRLGFTSGEFRCHSIAYFLLPLLRGIDKARYEVYCYSDTTVEDSFTKEIKKYCDGWLDTDSLESDALIQIIRDDRVDVLVELNGYTGRFRFEVFATKAAPIQVSYLGYPNTTGLSRIDYRLTDSWADPETKTEHLHAETLTRLPGGFLCFEADPEAPAVERVQRLKGKEGICFGSFNAFHKVTKDVISTWARVLDGVPDSTLLIKSFSLGDPVIREMIKRKFSEHGISAKRLILLDHTAGRKEHLALYAKVDIHLDTFPYNGTTTTCEALWQGVPSVVLAGSSHRSRVGVSILNQVGLTDFIAEDLDAYVGLAVSKAAEQASLEVLREGMRERMQNSPLMQVERFAKDFSAAIEGMYQRYID